ncbi:hypothetical protein CEP54_013610 [Fusarium duplospermum]|uniref:Uncharacterized protein n=1 Tax=Fusarium duplospermum TaxID=1325734 RepID=A0A428P1W5_9HYPO|nr:hypothetical protein CEP54_013610 [Fusarium duplospermum]
MANYSTRSLEIGTKAAKQISIYHLGVEQRSRGTAGQEFGETLVSQVKSCCVGLERFGRIRTHHIISRSTRMEEKLIEKESNHQFVYHSLIAMARSCFPYSNPPLNAVYPLFSL